MKPDKVLKRVGWAFIALSLLIISIGADLTDGDMTPLGGGEERGTINVQPSMEGATLLIYQGGFDETALTIPECNRIEIGLMGEDGNPLELRKTDCRQWVDREVEYLYRSNPMTAGSYSYESNTEIEIFALNGDLEEYMDQYATGTMLENLGCGTCCMGIFGLFGASRLRQGANGQNGEQVMIVNQRLSTIAKPYQPTQPVQSAQGTTPPSMYQAIVDQAEEKLPPAVEEAADQSGGFWGGIKED